MTYTKGDIVGEAFAELGFGSFDVSPEERVDAMKKLDAMMLTPPWSSLDHAIGVNPDTAMYAADEYRQAIVLNLAAALSGRYGKTLSPRQAMDAKKGLNDVQILTPIQAVAMTSRTPRGAGNRRVRGAVFYRPS